MWMEFNLHSFTACGSHHSFHFLGLPESVLNSLLHVIFCNVYCAILLHIKECIYIYKIYKYMILYIIYISYMMYIVSWNCVDTRWQQYITHLHTNNTQNDTKILEECGPCPVLARYTLAFALKPKKKHGKFSVRVAASKNTWNYWR